MKKDHHNSVVPSIQTKVLSVIALVIAALLIAFSGGTKQSAFSSVETQFTDASVSGLAIVPASCPSVPSNPDYPHVSGECSPTPDGPGGGGGVDGGTCVANAGASCQSGANACGMRRAGTVQCNGACSAGVPSNNLCAQTCWDGSPIVNGRCPACPAGYTRSGNRCLPPPGPTFVPFTSGTFDASGHLEVRPALVRTGDTSRVFWNVANVRSCTVTGSNGDGTVGSATGAWNTLGSGTEGKVTSAIMSRTTYTLFCQSLPGATPATITEVKTVNVIPLWIEN